MPAFKAAFCHWMDQGVAASNSWQEQNSLHLPSSLECKTTSAAALCLMSMLPPALVLGLFFSLGQGRLPACLVLGPRQTSHPQILPRNLAGLRPGAEDAGRLLYRCSAQTLRHSPHAAGLPLVLPCPLTPCEVPFHQSTHALPAWFMVPGVMGTGACLGCCVTRGLSKMPSGALFSSGGEARVGFY